MKMLLVVFGLLGMTSSFGQDITLKKLYDRVEDLKSDHQIQKSKPEIDAENLERIHFEEILKRNLETKLSKLYSGKSPNCNEAYRDGGLYVGEIFHGSFTRPKTKQSVVSYGYCPPIESYDFDCSAVLCGLAIVENEIVVANFVDTSNSREGYSVKDINQNNLTELMIVVQSKAKGIWGKMDSIQVLEFANAQPTSLGSFFVGGPSSFFDTYGLGDMIIRPSSICTSKAPKELRTHFPSNIIYVQKGKVPQFFAEGWEINCDYLEKGVKARKVSSLTPIKPVPRAVPLTRLF
jgi:hypothetical protein